MGIVVGTTFKMNGIKFIVTETSLSQALKLLKESDIKCVAAHFEDKPKFIKINAFDKGTASELFSLTIKQENFEKSYYLFNEIKFDPTPFVFNPSYDYEILYQEDGEKILEMLEVLVMSNR